MLFRDRNEAGRELAARLTNYSDRTDVLVLALPRGGVPVAFEVSQALHAPLDVFVVRKLGVPGHEELALGAISTGGVRVLNEDVVRTLRISDDVLDAVTEEELEELERRERLYRGSRPAPDAQGRTVILVDDGLETGSTMRAAVAAVVVAGVPVHNLPSDHQDMVLRALAVGVAPTLRWACSPPAPLFVLIRGKLRWCLLERRSCRALPGSSRRTP